MIGFRTRLSSFVVAVSCAELITAFDFDFELFGIVFILSLKKFFFLRIFLMKFRK